QAPAKKAAPKVVRPKPPAPVEKPGSASATPKPVEEPTSASATPKPVEKSWSTPVPPPRSPLADLPEPVPGVPITKAHVFGVLGFLALLLLRRRRRKNR
ncbi:MAG: hypothetical protein JWO12_2571, partial [Frankiales bacterium]|nr:hypothetical protein [Frankiales bacterium]